MARIPLQPMLAAAGLLNRFSQRYYMSIVLKLLQSSGVSIEGKPLWIGSSVRFDIEMAGDIKLGHACVLSEDVKILTHDYSMDRVSEARQWLDPNSELSMRAPVEIAEYAFVGMGALIMPGVRVGSNSVVAAGSVVTRSVPDSTIVAGNPAREISSVDHWVERSRHKFEPKLRRR